MRIKQLIILGFIISFSQTKITGQEVTMTSGFWKNNYYQDDKKINHNELTTLLKKEPLAFNHWAKAKTFNTLSWIALASEAGFTTWGIANNNPKNETATQIGVYGSFAVVIAFSLISHTQKKKAISTYNQGLGTSNTFSVKPSKSGFGIIVQF